jgi:hypothetical protein
VRQLDCYRRRVQHSEVAGCSKRLSGRGGGIAGYHSGYDLDQRLHVLAYNLTRVMNIVGVQPLLVAMRA